MWLHLWAAQMSSWRAYPASTTEDLTGETRRHSNDSPDTSGSKLPTQSLQILMQLGTDPVCVMKRKISQLTTAISAWEENKRTFLYKASFLRSATDSPEKHKNTPDNTSNWFVAFANFCGVKTPAVAKKPQIPDHFTNSPLQPALAGSSRERTLIGFSE